MEAATPSLPLVSCSRRNIAVSVDADSLEVAGSLAYAVVTLSHSCLLAASTHEEHLIGLLEVGCVLQLIGAELPRD